MMLLTLLLLSSCVLSSSFVRNRGLDPDRDDVDWPADCDSTDDSVGVDCAGPCAGGGWGLADHVADKMGDQVLHVQRDPRYRVAGFAAGHLFNPYDDLSEAIEDVLEKSTTIIVGPGVYVENLDLWDELDGPRVGPTILGCSAEEVSIEARNPVEPVWRQHPIDYEEDPTSSLVLALTGVTLSGGTRSVLVYGRSKLNLTDVVISGATRAGIHVWGATASVDLERVRVDAVSSLATADPDVELGVGVSVHQGAFLSARELSIDDAVGIGLQGLSADRIVVDQLTVQRTRAMPGGGLGYGVHLDDPVGGVLAVLTGAEIIDSTGVAVFVDRPLDVLLTDITITGVLPDPSTPVDPAADGIVLVQDLFNFSLGESAFVAELEEVRVEGHGRVPILASGSLNVSVKQATHVGPGDTDPFYVQDGAAVPAGATSETPTELLPPVSVRHWELPPDPPQSVL